MILGIWNARVDGVVVRHAFARTVVLIKGPQLLDFAIFETELKRFDPSLFHWERNSRGNLVGRDANEIHRFTWQPSGSQFTIIEKIPLNRHYVKFDVPEELIVQDNDAMLDSLGFTEDWIILDREN